MTIASMLKQIRDGLDAWAKTRSGSAQIAGDPVELFSILRMKPGGFRCAVMFHSEAKRGQYEESGGVDRTFWVGISRGRSMKLERGDDLVETASGGAPLFDLIEEARQIIRNLEFDRTTTEVHVDYKGINPYNTEGVLLDAYNLEFTIGVQLPAPEDTETSQAATP